MDSQTEFERYFHDAIKNIYVLDIVKNPPLVSLNGLENQKRPIEIIINSLFDEELIPFISLKDNEYPSIIFYILLNGFIVVEINLDNNRDILLLSRSDKKIKTIEDMRDNQNIINQSLNRLSFMPLISFLNYASKDENFYNKLKEIVFLKLLRMYMMEFSEKNCKVFKCEDGFKYIKCD
jgi:hypothetical protein